MKASLKEQVYNSILQDIIQGVYSQEDILSERALIEKYGVSKSPVRDALIELCNERVLRSIPRYGYEIVRLTERDVKDIIEFRAILEVECLDAVCRSADDKALRELLEYARRNSDADRPEDVLKHWDNNLRFHLRLNALAGNQYCYGVIRDSLNTLTRAYAQFYWDRWQRVRFIATSQAHIDTVQALLERDVVRAKEALRNDICSFDTCADQPQ